MLVMCNGLAPAQVSLCRSVRRGDTSTCARKPATVARSGPHDLQARAEIRIARRTEPPEPVSEVDRRALLALSPFLPREPQRGMLSFVQYLSEHARRTERYRTGLSLWFSEAPGPVRPP